MQVQMGDLPDGPVVKLLPSNTGGAGSILSQGTKISYASGPKNKAKQNIKWKQCCNKFKKGFKNGPHQSSSSLLPAAMDGPSGRCPDCTLVSVLALPPLQSHLPQYSR